MRRHTRLTIGLITVATGVLAPGAPVAAGGHPAQVAIVQGMPGVRVDLCLDGKEIRSGVRYGRKTIRALDPGDYKLKVFKRDPRTCKGKKVAQRSFTLEADGDLSLVVGRGVPKVLIFDNAGLVPVTPAVENLTIVWRHAANAGPINFWVEFAEIVNPAASPSAIFRGQEVVIDGASSDLPLSLVTYVSRDEERRALAGPILTIIEANRRHEIYFIGSKRKNYRLFEFGRPHFIAP